MLVYNIEFILLRIVLLFHETVFAGNQMATFAVGIDLGTTHSCVSVYQYGKIEIITNEHGSKITPSWVAFTNTDTLVGEPARYQASLNSKNTIYGNEYFLMHSKKLNIIF